MKKRLLKFLYVLFLTPIAFYLMRLSAYLILIAPLIALIKPDYFKLKLFDKKKDA